MQQINKPYEGLFITIEGGEGSGKSTLSQKLAEELQKRGYEVVKTREPGGSALSEYLRNLLLNPSPQMKIGSRAELLLFLAARAQHIEELIAPALRESKVVICERFNDSTIAYQGSARHLGMHAVENLCKAAFEGCSQPDCTLFLDIDPEEGFKRVKAQRGEAIDRMEKEKLQFHREVRQGYLHLADQHQDRIVVLDAALPLETVFKAALEGLEPHLMLKPTRAKK